MEDNRRQKLGEMMLDITKYVATIVVISGIVSERVNFRSVTIGLLLAIVLGWVGYWLLSPRRAKKEDGR